MARGGGRAAGRRGGEMCVSSPDEDEHCCDKCGNLVTCCGPVISDDAVVALGRGWGGLEGLQG